MALLGRLRVGSAEGSLGLVLKYLDLLWKKNWTGFHTRSYQHRESRAPKLCRCAKNAISSPTYPLSFGPAGHSAYSCTSRPNSRSWHCRCYGNHCCPKTVSSSMTMYVPVSKLRKLFLEMPLFLLCDREEPYPLVALESFANDIWLDQSHIRTLS